MLPFSYVNRSLNGSDASELTKSRGTQTEVGQTEGYRQRWGQTERMQTGQETMAQVIVLGGKFPESLLRYPHLLLKHREVFGA